MLTARGLSRGATNAMLHPKGLLREGNGLLNVGFAASSVGGAALGGLLVDLFGVETALLVDAGSFAVVAIVLADLPPPAARRGRAGAVPRPPAQRAALRADESRHAAADRRRGIGDRLLHADRADRDRLRVRDAAHRRPRLRGHALGLGRRDRARQRGVPGGPAAARERAHTLVHPRHRLRLSRHGRRARAVGRLRVLDPGRARQRRAVGLGDDGAAGVDARRPPGAHHRPARVDRRPPPPASGS